jgi:large subunit ribosomal protein L33
MVVKLVSMAGTGFFYTTTKNPAATRKLFLQKYDPMLGSHTLFRVRFPLCTAPPF